MLKKCFIISALCISFLVGCGNNKNSDEDKKPQVYNGKTAAEWSKQLKDQSAELRMKAITALEVIRDKTYLPELIDALQDTEPKVRMAAATALGTLGESKAVPALIKALKDKTAGVRGNAAFAFSKIKDKTAVPDLILALGDASDDVKKSAARALGAIKDHSAIPALVETLKVENQTLSLSVVAALINMGKKAIPQFVGYLSSGHARVRLGMTVVLGKLRAREAVRGLIDTINDKEEKVSESAIRSLKYITGKTFGGDVEEWRLWWSKEKSK